MQVEASRMPDGVTREDVVLAILAASTALGGFMLVFLGLAVNAARSFPGESVRAVKDKYRRVAYLPLATFWWAMASVLVALAWLLLGKEVCLYGFCLGMFAAEVIAMVAVATVTTVRLVK